MAEVGNKDREFWKTLEVVLIESWIEEKNWMKVKSCRKEDAGSKKEKQERKNDGRNNRIIGIKKELAERERK